MKLKSYLYALAPVLFLAAPGTASAQLKWSETSIELWPATADLDAIAHYHFKNVGKSTVTIIAVETSCGCTTARADKTAYKHGEEGIITADYSVPSIAGLLQQKTITVTTDARNNPVSELHLKILLPEVLKIEPPTLTWRLNDAPTPKTVAIEVLEDHEVNIVEILWGLHNRYFQADLRAVEQHKKYLVTVTPRSTDSAADQTMRVITDYPRSQPKTVWVPVRIVSPGETPAPASESHRNGAGEPAPAGPFMVGPPESPP